ncbi:MAG: hypothetical protein ACOYWZ_13535 [Bacillota bacterium]
MKTKLLLLLFTIISIMFALTYTTYSKRPYYPTNPIDQALIKWVDYSQSNPQDITKSYSNLFTQEDKKFKELFLNLGIEHLPEIIERVNDDRWGFLMIDCVQGMTKIKNVWNIGSSKEQRKAWLDKFKETVNSAEKRVKSKDDIQSLGLFAVPFIMDELEKENYEYLEYLPDLVDEYTGLSKGELQKKDIAFWKRWSKKHERDIKVLRNIALQ